MAARRLLVIFAIIATLTLLAAQSLGKGAAAQQLQVGGGSFPYLEMAPAAGGADLFDSSDLLAAANQFGGERNSPGHYEFEAAPQMEPPSVRKPPYTQTEQDCPGSGKFCARALIGRFDACKGFLSNLLFACKTTNSDIFGGFSPRDTLCGDLNQGKVPRNPLGQSVTEQSYPFELIKNKTLQFLARALPVLRSEYETIPKVARYLPANRLLNPTHTSSPLGSDHFQELNQRLSGAHFYSTAAASGDEHVRRRKRSPQPPGAGIAVGQLMPNVTLVVSSAHSSAPSAGRIQQAAPLGQQLAMITRDGYRPATRRQAQPPAPRPVANGDTGGATGATAAGAEQRKQAAANKEPLQENGHAATSGRNHATLAAQENRVGAAAPTSSSSSSGAGDNHTEPLQERSAPAAAATAAHEQQPQRRQDSAPAPQSSNGQTRRKLACGELGGFSSA